MDALPAAMRAKLENDVVLIVTEGEAAAYLADLHTDAVVIRPDRHILGIASTPAELDAVTGVSAVAGAARRHFQADAENRRRNLNPGDIRRDTISCSIEFRRSCR